MPLNRSIDATAEPITLAQAKEHLNITSSFTTDDTLITGLVQLARQQCEESTRRSLLAQTWVLKLDRFPGADDPIELKRTPVLGVSSITYIDSAGTTQTLAASAYDVDTDSFCANVRPVYSTSWPSTRSTNNAVTVTYTAGYGVPFTSTFAADTITTSGHAFVDDETVRLSNQGGALPAGLDSTTLYYVVSASGSTCSLSLTSGGAAVTITDDGTGLHTIGAVPLPIIHALKMYVSDFYENRESQVVGTTANNYAITAEMMLDKFRVLGFH